MRNHPAVRRDLSTEVAAAAVRLPPRAIGQALRSLVTNAQDASPAETPVVVRVTRTGDRLRIVVADRGPGMSPEVLARIGEPFFTTKSPGRGMGLGLFLARAVIESVGGTLTIDSGTGEGTRVAVTVPVEIGTGPARHADPDDNDRAGATETPGMVSKVA